MTKEPNFSKQMDSASEKYQPITITYHNISYAVSIKKGRKSLLKSVLDNCSGTLRPGLNAILGPSGSGKTSLIRILAGRTDKHSFSGNIIVNGEHQQNNFRSKSGFVVQDDIICGNLSVRENLAFSASLRLRRKHGNKERKALVDKIIEDLCLTECANRCIGTDEIRGVSGGERKRTCIGMEMITEPDILFLDEPTTGLDSTTALHILELLQKQAEQSRTIVFTIHQPRYSIFKLFDYVTLMSQGKIVFAGPQNQMIGYFDGIGYTCEPNDNPADHVLDVITTDQIRCAAEDFEGIDLVHHFRNSNLFRDAYHEIQVTMENIQQGDSSDVENDNQYKIEHPSSFVEQLSVLSKRLLVNNFREKRAFLVHYLTPLTVSLCFGAIFYNIGYGEGAIQNRIGLTVMLLILMVLLNAKNGLLLFMEQRHLFLHEYENGYYGLPAFFFSGVVLDMILMKIGPAIIYAIPAYFLAGCQVHAENFFICVFTLIMTTIPATAISIWSGTCSSNFFIAHNIMMMIYRLTFLFGGVLIRFNDIPVWLRWLQYLSVFKYAFSNLIYNELHGLTFNKCGSYRNESCEMSDGDMFLESQGIDHSSELIWMNIGVLAAITVGFLLSSYIMLKRITA